MSETVRTLGRLAGGMLVLSLAACGGGGGGGPTTPIATPVPTPTPPVVVSQGTGSPLAAGYVGSVNVTTTRTGTLDVTVDWTDPANDLDVLLTRGACTFDQLAAYQCTILAYSDSTTAKPEKMHAENAAAGTYSLFVDNVGPGDESVSFQVVLTPTTAAAAPPSASSRRAQAMPLGHKRALRGVVELR